MNRIKIFFFPIVCLVFVFLTSKKGSAQQADFQKRYEIADITVSGTQYLDGGLLKAVAGLSLGDKIMLQNDPAVAKAIRSLWEQKVLEDVRIDISKVEDSRVWLDIAIKERPRMGTYTFKGISKGQESELKDKLHIAQNRMVTEAMKVDIIEKTKKFFAEKGFLNVHVAITESKVSNQVNTVALNIIVFKGSKVKINQISFAGNNNSSDLRLKRTLKGTKEMPRLSLHPAYTSSVYSDKELSFKKYIQDKGYLYPSRTLNALDPYFRYNFFASSKFDDKKYDEDKHSLIAYYNSIGYRDAQIEKDTVYYTDNGNLNIDIKIEEGKRYYFGDIDFRGNTVYSDSTLRRILNINKGDSYDRQYLESRLGAYPSMDGKEEIGSLYMDNGYLFFRIEANEKSINGDTINFEIAIQEGPQATIKDIRFLGNLRTNEHVLRRETFTMPGNKFSRADIIRSIRQISNLGFIDPEKVNPNPKPNYADGTVDIDYELAEKSSDQLELSAGYGGQGIRFTGSLGLVFNNFSLRNLFRFKEWDPLPMGDGQKLSIRFQSNGLWYNSANFSFTEPWLGGKKPNALTVHGMYSRIAMGMGNMFSSQGSIGDPTKSYFSSWGGGVSISSRLSWPDNYFVFSYGANYQVNYLKDFELFDGVDFKNGYSNNLFFRFTLARTSVDQPIYPRSGSNINFTFQFTPPYSMFSNKDYSNIEAKDKYKWIEYHKYRFTADWYQRIAGNFVLKLSAKYGFLGHYHKDLVSPFERFQVGGDGLTGFNFFVGRDIISHRGYDIYTYQGTVFNKYTAEVRYPFSLNPSATIFGLVFAEGANAWNSFGEYNPFRLNRSAGVGVRVFLPMFGLLGLDYGIGFDNWIPGSKLTQAAKFTFMLGQEPD